MKLVVVITMLAAPVAAQTFSLPPNCEGYLTVQNRKCEVDHHFRCDGDPVGEKSRITLSENGMVYMGTIDDETQWLVSHHMVGGQSEKLESKPAERASFSDLVATGFDDYYFRMLSPENGVTRYVGCDTLTSKQVVIDGVTLDETTYDLTAYAADGTQSWRTQGSEFISRDWRMFLSGKGSATTPNDTYETDGTPVQFITLSESCFLSIKPKFGCGALMSSFEVTP